MVLAAGFTLDKTTQGVLRIEMYPVLRLFDVKKPKHRSRCTRIS